LLRYALFVLRFRGPLLALALVLVGASLAAAPGLRLDFSVFPLLEANEEAKREIERFARDLPPRRADALCLLEWPASIEKADLDTVARLSERLVAVPGVSSATSLATAWVIEPRLGVPMPRRLVDVVGEGPVIDHVRRHPLLLGRLLSNDGRTAAIVLVRSPREPGDAAADWIERAREAVLEEAPEGVAVRFVGAELVEAAMARTMWRDMIRSLALEAACFLVLLPLLFRSVRAVVLPFVVIGSAILLDIGFMRLFDLSLSLIEVAIPGLVTIIALCDTIHMLHRFEEALARTGDRRAAILEMMDRVGKACLYTSLTTAIGFFALLVAEHRAVRDFALSATLAVMIAFLCVVTLLPALLSIWPVATAHPPGGLRHFVRLRYGRRSLTLTAFGALAILCAAGIAQIRVGARWLDELPSDEPAVHDLAWYQARFGGFLDLEVKLEGPLDSVEAARAVSRLERRLLDEPGVKQAESYVDWIREVIGVPDGDLADAQVLAGLLALKVTGTVGSFAAHVVTPNWRMGRILFRTEDIGTARFLELVRVVDEESANLPNGIRAEVAGFSRMAHESSRLVVTTMMLSLIASMGTISVFIMVVYESVKLGLLCVVPNAIPVLAALGLTGWLGIPLRIGIVMIYSLGVGLAVDNTIHLVTRYIQERRSHPAGTLHQHLVRSLDTTGSALLASSTVLVLGALCYLPASFRSMSDVGVLLSTMVIVAFVTDVLLVPHLIEIFGGPGGRSRFGAPLEIPREIVDNRRPS